MTDPAAPVDLSVYDVAGRHLRTLVSGRVAPGTHRASRDGRDEAAGRQPAGVYFHRLRVGGRSISRLLVQTR